MSEPRRWTLTDDGRDWAVSGPGPDEVTAIKIRVMPVIEHNVVVAELKSKIERLNQQVSELTTTLKLARNGVYGAPFRKAKLE